MIIGGNQYTSVTTPHTTTTIRYHMPLKIRSGPLTPDVLSGRSQRRGRWAQSCTLRRLFRSRSHDPAPASGYLSTRRVWRKCARFHTCSSSRRVSTDAKYYFKGPNVRSGWNLEEMRQGQVVHHFPLDSYREMSMHRVNLTRYWVFRSSSVLCCKLASRSHVIRQTFSLWSKSRPYI